MPDWSPTTDVGPPEVGPDRLPATEAASATVLPPSSAGSRHRRRPRRGPAVTILGRDVGLAAVAVTSMVVQILAFVVAAAITRFSITETAFRWDTTWFYRIAEHGYLHRVPNGPTDYAGLRIAFFPGLPLVERAVHAVIGGDPVDTTFLVGTAGLVVSCIALWALVARDFDESAAWRSVVL